MSLFKKVPIYFYNPRLLWQDEHCFIVSSNSLLFQSNPSLTEAMREYRCFCLSVTVSVSQTEACVSVRGLLTLGMTISINTDTRVCCNLGLFKLSIGVCVGSSHTEKVIRLIKLKSLPCLFPLLDSVKKFRDAIYSKSCQNWVSPFLRSSSQLTLFPQGPFSLDWTEILKSVQDVSKYK